MRAGPIFKPSKWKKVPKESWFSLQNNGNTIHPDDDYFEMNRYHTKNEDNINEGSVEVIKDKLYFVSSDTAPLSNEDSYYFKTDDLVELEYEPFNKDFGPLKLSMVHRYC